MARAHTLLSRAVSALVSDHGGTMTVDGVPGSFAVTVGGRTKTTSLQVEGMLPDESMVVMLAPVATFTPRTGMRVTVDGRPMRIADTQIHASAWTLNLTSPSQ